MRKSKSNFIFKQKSSENIAHKHRRVSTPKLFSVQSSQPQFRQTNIPRKSLQVFRKIKANNYLIESNPILHESLSKKLIHRNIKCETENVLKDKKFVPSRNETQRIILKQSAKLRKLLWNEQVKNLPPLVLSADFIMDQDMFWGKMEIHCSVIQVWKWLHRKYFVIWVIRSQNAFSVINNFCQSYNLGLHSIFYFKNENKYTTDYTRLEQQLAQFYNSPQLSEVIILLNLKVNTRDHCTYSSYLRNVPIILNPAFKVYYIRTEKSSTGINFLPQFFQGIAENKSNKIIKLYSIRHFIEEYLVGVIRENDQKQRMEREREKPQVFNPNEENQSEQKIEQKIESFRKQLIDYMIGSKGRLFQYEGNSIYYLVGDIVKRNRHFLEQSYRWNAPLHFQSAVIHGTQPMENLNLTDNFYEYIL